MGGGVWQDKGWYVIQPSDVGINIAAINFRHKKSFFVRLIDGVGAFGLLLARGINKLWCLMWAWLARPGNVGYSVMTIELDMQDWHKEELAEWDAAFQRTQRLQQPMNAPTVAEAPTWACMTLCECRSCNPLKLRKRPRRPYSPLYSNPW